MGAFVFRKVGGGSTFRGGDTFRGAAGAAEITGSGTASIPAVAAVGIGDVIVEGAGVADLLAIQAVGTGTVVGGEISGSGTADLSAVAAAGVGTVVVDATGVADLMAIAALGSGSVVSGISGSGTAAIGPIAMGGDGAVLVSGTGIADLPTLELAGNGSVVVGGDGAALLSAIRALGAGGEPPTVVLPPFAIIGDTTRPEPWSETQRPDRWDATERPFSYGETARGDRWDGTERPARWMTTNRPEYMLTSERPSFWAETIFVREDRDVALTMVAYGPFTENEIPEALLIRVMKPLKAGGTAPMVIFGQTPAYTAQVSIKDPVAAVVTRAAEVMDPANLPIDYPDDFSASEEGWIRVIWASTDFTAEGTYEVQVTLDNGTVLLKSTDVWQPEVNVGPASAVV